jgi:hypothetical protein
LDHPPRRRLVVVVVVSSSSSSSSHKIPLRRARLLAAQATTIGHVDLAEAARAMVKAAKLAPTDT